MISPCNSDEIIPDLLPVRRLHNYVYCPRLFYLQWVEDIFLPNEDTVIGSSIHKRVDEPERLKQDILTENGGNLRSLHLSSEHLGITGIIDLLEHDECETCIVDYKKGNPLKNESGDWVAKHNDIIQLAAYALLLEEQGIIVNKASIYYAGIRRHIKLFLTTELKDECRKLIHEAKTLAKEHVCPPPLSHSTRCLACSAYPICLPFESGFWAANNTPQKDTPMRPPMPPDDGGEVLVVQNTQATVGIRNGEIMVKLNGDIVARHPVHQLQAVYLYGSVQVSAQALSVLMEESIPVSYFSPAGRFIGMAHGLSSSGVDARIGQCRMWENPNKRLLIAAEIIRAKIHNQRVILMRNGSPPTDALAQLAQLRDACAHQTSLAALRGIEGSAAAIYFANFSTMIKANLGFDFTCRNRRPPKDPVNALLSLAYSILSKELTGIAYSVGLDPFLGFFHSPRYGRPALALDMMEEFRPLIADSSVLTLINRGEITPDDFVNTTRGVMLKDSGRRQFWRAWVRRLDTEITHPTFGYRMSYRRMMDVQMRQFWRFCRGDISRFYGFTTR